MIIVNMIMVAWPICRCKQLFQFDFVQVNSALVRGKPFNLYYSFSAWILLFGWIMEFCVTLCIFSWSQTFQSEFRYSEIWAAGERLPVNEAHSSLGAIGFFSAPAAESILFEVWVWPKMSVEYIKHRFLVNIENVVVESWLGPV